MLFLSNLYMRYKNKITYQDIININSPNIINSRLYKFNIAAIQIINLLL